MVMALAVGDNTEQRRTRIAGVISWVQNDT
jgi:hypothetical protein